MARNIITQTIKKFRGLNLMTVQSNLGPEWAQSCLNCIPSAGGGIEKIRIPTVKSAAIAALAGLGNMANFQNALGVRQIIVQIGEYLYKFELDSYAASAIDQDVLNVGVMSFEQSNNIMFMANGNRMAKWTGTNFWQWGIDKAPAPTFTTASGQAGGIVPNPTTGSVWVDSKAGQSMPERTLYFSYTLVNAAFQETLQSQSVLTYTPAGNQVMLYSIPWGQHGNLPDPTISYPEAIGWYLYGGTVEGSQKRLCTRVLGFFETLEEMGNAWESSPTIDPPTENETGTTINIGAVDLDEGRRYRVAYGNSVTEHIGAASDATESSGPVAGGYITLQVVAPTDEQCDRVWLYSTKDGGSDYYLNPNPNSDDGSWSIIANGSPIIIVDGVADEDLDMSRIAPLLNYPPPVGRYLTKHQGRIFIANLSGAKQDIAYSGYERIFSGRPEESFPPNNRIRLAIGADELNGIGAIPGGVVAFSKSNEAFAFRGNVEDVTTEAPVQYSAFLEELRWDEGCASHWSIVATPQGLIWLGADLVLKVWNGGEKPYPISTLQHPFFRSVTPGQASNARGLFFNYLEKEFYVLALPYDGASCLNRILVVDLNEIAEQNIGAVPLAIGDVDAMDVVEDTNSLRQLIILQGGALRELRLLSTTVCGLSESGSAK